MSLWLAWCWPSEEQSANEPPVEEETKEKAAPVHTVAKTREESGLSATSARAGQTASAPSAALLTVIAAGGEVEVKLSVGKIGTADIASSAPAVEETAVDDKPMAVAPAPAMAVASAMAVAPAAVQAPAKAVTPSGMERDDSAPEDTATPMSALSKAIAAAAAATAATADAPLPSPRTAMRQREAERQQERDLELEKQRRLLEQLEEQQKSKNQKLRAKEAKREKKEKAKEEALKAKREEAKVGQIESLLDQMRGLDDAAFEARVAPIFRAMDHDLSGYIDIHELRKVMQALRQPMTEEQLAGMMAEADTSGDHTINLPEFCVILRKQIQEGSGVWAQLGGGRSSLFDIGSWFSPKRSKPASSRGMPPATAPPTTSKAPSTTSPTSVASPTSPAATRASPAATRASPAATRTSRAATRAAAVTASSATARKRQKPRGSPVGSSSAASSAAVTAIAPAVGGASHGVSPTKQTKQAAGQPADGAEKPVAGSPFDTPPMSSEEAMLRAKLRNAFKMMDADGSGAISASEMSKVLKLCGMQKSPAELAALMQEADPDGSGEIDEGEFYAVLTKQMREGKGQLASTVAGAGSFFGWLNPFSWFADDSQKQLAGPVEYRSPVEAYGGGTWKFPMRLASDHSPEHQLVVV